MLNVADSDDRPTREAYTGKLHAIGYGFLVPVFFVVTGVQFDLRSLFASVSTLALLPALVAGILIVRVGQALLTGPRSEPGRRSLPDCCRRRR